MQGGKLSNLLLFQEPIISTPGGFRTLTWTDVFRVWGEVQDETEQSCRFVIRYKTDITPASHRIIWSGKIFAIINAVADRKRTMLRIDADFTQFVESTDLDDAHTQYVGGIPILRPRE